jgi:hypothetical protein
MAAAQGSGVATAEAEKRASAAKEILGVGVVAGSKDPKPAVPLDLCNP